MAKRKDCNYKWARENIYTKDLALNNFIDNMLIKCNQMFIYKNLPDSVPKRVLEKMLMENGYCIFTKHNDKFVILNGGLGGELNEYYEYTQCIVSNPYLKLEKTFNLGADCVLIRNDCRMCGLIPLLSKYAVLCGDCEMSINMLTNTLRTQVILSAGDNKTKESADLFIKRLIDGEFSTIGENGFLDGVKVHNITTNANYIQQFVELNQYLKASAYNEIGLDANFNMKRERLTVNEVELNTSILIPMADDMLEQRKIAVAEINKMYGLNIEVDLSSVWKMQKETVDKATETENTETPAETETPTVPTNDTVNKTPTVPNNDTVKRKELIAEIEKLDSDFFNNVNIDEMSNDDLQTALDNMSGGKNEN